MTAYDNDATTGYPKFRDSDAPDVKLDPQLVAEYAAEVGNRLVKSTAGRLAYGYARKGLECYDTDLDTTFIHDGTSWVDSSSVAPATTTFTASSAVTLDGVFAAGFTVHRITLNITSGSAAAGIYMRYRAGGSTLSASSTYITQLSYNSSDTTFFTGKDTDTNSQIAPGATTSPRFLRLDVTNALSGSVPTFAVGEGFTWVSSHHILSHVGLRFTPTTAVDGVTFYPASGTITGSITVEGVA